LSRSDPIEPAVERSVLADRSRLAGEDEKRGLEDVLRGVGVILQQPAAETVDERAMTPHQGLERRLVAGRDEPAQQLAICRLGRISHPAKMIEHNGRGVSPHRAVS
jgi:hypothetical protein